MNICTSVKTGDYAQEQAQKEDFTTLHHKLTTDLILDQSFQKMKKSCEKSLYVYKSGRKINPKMLIKLIGWLERVCKLTFHFSMKTLQLAIKILFKYLDCYDENYQELQLVGCAVLHMASKLNENFIIGTVCYCQAALNSFTPEQLNEKEQHIFMCLEWDINFSTFDGIIDYLSTKMKLEDGHVIALKTVSETLMKTQFVWALKETDVLLTLITMLKLEGKLLPIPQLLQLLN